MALSRIKYLKLGLFCTKHGSQYYLVYSIVLNCWELKIIVICLKLLVKLRFFGFLSVVGIFAHKVAQTLFVLHETWHTTLFGIYYRFEVVWIKIHSHILEKFHVKLRFYGFLSRFGTFVQLGVYSAKPCTQNYLVYIFFWSG